MFLTALVKNQTGRVFHRNVYVKEYTMIPKVHQGPSPATMTGLLCSSGSQLLIDIFFCKNAPSQTFDIALNNNLDLFIDLLTISEYLEKSNFTFARGMIQETSDKRNKPLYFNELMLQFFLETLLSRYHNKITGNPILQQTKNDLPNETITRFFADLYQKF